MIKVCKFGGTSLADSSQYKKVKSIIDKDSSRRVIIVSAPGKRNKSDYKITDLLYLTESHIKYHVDYNTIFNQIKDRFYEIKNSLNLDIDLDKEFEKMKVKMDDGSMSEEELVSRGEYLSAKCMASYLGYTFIDAKNIIHFMYDGRVDEDKTQEAIENMIRTFDKVVVPGFYGIYPNGEICLFSRGGSDVTGSYLAKGVHADLYENWTDVSGIFMTDPKIIPNCRKINEVTYAELRELSYLGASVLHEETILPIQEENIPLEIKNTNSPDEPGTFIMKDCVDKTYLCTGITGKKNFVSLTFTKRRLADKLKVMLFVFKILDKYKIDVEHVPTSIDSFSIVVNKNDLEGKFYEMIAEIKQNPDIINVKVDEDIALIGVVGRNMANKAGTSGRILSVFGKEKINIKLIDQSTEELNIIIGISNQDFNKSIEVLYNKFAFEKID